MGNLVFIGGGGGEKGRKYRDDCFPCTKELFYFGCNIEGVLRLDSGARCDISDLIKVRKLSLLL